MRVHIAVSGPSAFGWTLNTTLCGNMSGQSPDGMNSAGLQECTCKNCLKIFANAKHWRHRKYLTKAGDFS